MYRTKPSVHHFLLIFLISFSWLTSLYSEGLPDDEVKNIIRKSTITRTQEPFIIHTDRETLEYFMEHVEELTKHGRDFSKGELILEAKGNSQYNIHIPSKHITGKFQLAEWQPNKVIYQGHGNASTFLKFSGLIVLEVDYLTKDNNTEPSEQVKTTVHLKFDNAFFALLAKAASPVFVPKLDKFITKFTNKVKNIVETTYTTRNTPG
ncbi:MAG: hypothetical protein ACUBOA_04695 [Candidatus Loosdrechtia sp.]|uniref:hypothetical protein n=1 Tax=Candidatus Loosdrechtia sp. TaxID=3101272 RepID=UPI003A657444|nr:MAG: hypothetical protein QY305_05220 [Candidatus Jettenia sp. AMX2]